MKLLVASDIHGSSLWCAKLMGAIASEDPLRVILLGDLLYHGPRNALPDGYAPKEVVAMLSGIKDKIIAVRGNCEAEVDQMLLDFPCMSDYTVLFDAEQEREIFCTHGHVFGPGFHNSVTLLPSLRQKTIVFFGHTHIKVNEDFLYAGETTLRACNPGSVSLPKDGTCSYGVYEDGVFRHVILV